MLKIARVASTTTTTNKYIRSTSFATTIRRTMSSSHQYDYDLVVIGGGSGGLQLSKVSADLGAKVALLDFVKPSTQGSEWGLGGTCVNVGCIPKKLMHFAALAGDKVEESVQYGWDVVKKDESTLENIFKHFPSEERRKHFHWNTLVDAVQNTIRGSNFVYRTELRSKKVNYINALGRLIDAHTIELLDKKGIKKQITSQYITVAVGGRPHIPSDVPGALEYAITSDDIFSLEHAPGDTLVVGGAYIALETAGFLGAFGYNVDVAVRSRILRDKMFDREVVEQLEDNLAQHVNLLHQIIPVKIDKLENGKKRVTFRSATTNEVTQKDYDTVMFATGRRPDTAALNLEAVGIQVDSNNGKVIVNNREETAVPNIFAIGDIIENGYNFELTPVAIQQGKLLAWRLFKNSTKQVEYDFVPSTVFTPMEYGLVGLSEEEAAKRYSPDQLVIYKKKFNILEYKVPQREEKGFVKLVCVKEFEDERVVGLHYLGPNAGEVVQGFALALKKGVTKEDFDNLIGIHPTNAESFVYLQEGVFEDKSCCG
jgi:thioredoxin/glutathione reductase (selenoprotein)